MRTPDSSEKAQRRKLNRRQIFVGEGLDVILLIGDQRFLGHIVDLTIGGIGVIVPVELLPKTLIQVSQVIQVEFKAVNTYRTREDAVIANISDFSRLGQEFVRLGIAIQNQRPQGFASNERSELRYKTSNLRPACYFAHPLFFRTTVNLEIVEINASGLTCVTSLTNDTLFPNLLVRLTIYFPMGGLVQVDARLVHARLSQEHNAKLEVGFEILSKLDEFRERASEFILMNNQDTSLDDLRKSGFKLEVISKSVKYRYANSDELPAIADLRLLCLKTDHPDKTFTLDDVIDDYDQHSRHFVGLINGKIISSSRLIFNNGVRTRSEYHPYDIEIPDWLWREGFAEAGRLITHPEYRGANLFIQMLQCVGLAATSSGYRYVVLSSASSLEKLYSKVGAKKIGTFTIPSEGSCWTLYYMDMQKSVKGYYSGPLAWWFFHKPLLEIGVSKNLVLLTPLERLRITLFKLIGTMATTTFKWMKKMKVRY